MKFFGIFLLSATLVATTCVMASAQILTGFPTSEDFSADGEVIGTFCCVKEICVLAKTEADCEKISGTKIKSCKECERPVEKE
jgi:hypothetical protein